MTQFSIGQLAKLAGVAIDTIRYYERDGLLQAAGRQASGYRRYGPNELRRLRFIRRAKALGFSLDDIRDLLSLSDARAVGPVKALAISKRDQIAARIAELRRIQDGLEFLIQACPGHGSPEACPILSALGAETES